jgi:hypothetical protein
MFLSKSLPSENYKTIKRKPQNLLKDILNDVNHVLS